MSSNESKIGSRTKFQIRFKTGTRRWKTFGRNQKLSNSSWIWRSKLLIFHIFYVNYIFIFKINYFSNEKMNSVIPWNRCNLESGTYSGRCFRDFFWAQKVNVLNKNSEYVLFRAVPVRRCQLKRLANYCKRILFQGSSFMIREKGMMYAAYSMLGTQFIFGTNCLLFVIDCSIVPNIHCYRAYRAKVRQQKYVR